MSRRPHNYGQTKIVPGSDLEAKVVSLYQSGKTLLQVEEELNGFVSCSAIMRALKRAGVQTRKRGKPKVDPKDGLTDGQRKYRKYRSDPVKHKTYITRKRLERLSKKFGITKDQIREIEEDQGGRCSICDAEPSSGKFLCLDHCHRTGGIRGFLCDHCNTMIGMARDNPEFLEKAAFYVRAVPFIKKTKLSPKESNG